MENLMYWLSSETKPIKNQLVIIEWINENKKINYSLGYYVDRFSEESDLDENYDEYNEIEGKYYLCEGWYEKCHENCEFSMMFLNHRVIKWMGISDISG